MELQSNILYIQKFKLAPLNCFINKLCISLFFLSFLILRIFTMSKQPKQYQQIYMFLMIGAQQVRKQNMFARRL